MVVGLELASLVLMTPRNVPLRHNIANLASTVDSALDAGAYSLRV
jgi:hypothetical protein